MSMTFDQGLELLVNTIITHSEHIGKDEKNSSITCYISSFKDINAQNTLAPCVSMRIV